MVSHMDSAEVINHLEDDRHRWIGRAGLSALTLVAANATVLLLFVVYDLTLFQLVVLFWVETFWIGIFCAFKVIAASIFGDPWENKYVEVSAGGNLFLSVISIGFVGAQWLGLFGMTGLAIFFARESFAEGTTSSFIMEDFGLIIGTAGIFFVGHGLSFVVNFLVFGEFRNARAGTLLMLPFKRSLALLGAIVLAFGAMLAVPEMASTTSFAIVLMTLKVLWDYRLHVAERKAFEDAGQQAPAGNE